LPLKARDLALQRRNVAALLSSGFLGGSGLATGLFAGEVEDFFA
jgi:hypothetical protein